MTDKLQEYAQLLINVGERSKRSICCYKFAG